MGEHGAVDGRRQLENLADLGLPVPRTRFRRLKRLVTRLSWFILRRQVEYNHELARSIERLAADVAQVTHRSADRDRTLGELRLGLDQLKASRARRRDDERQLLRGALGTLRESLVRATDAVDGKAGSGPTGVTSAVGAGRSTRVGGSTPSLSVCCLTSDPGPSVAALLGQLRPVADEIFVAVDSRTDPSSLGLLLDVSDRVVRYDFAPPFERALAWAHAQCAGDWVLRIDSDEVAAPSLVEALPELIQADDVVEYHIPRRWLYPDGRHWLDEYPWSMDYQARLVRNDPATLWFEGVVHSNTGQARPAVYLEHPLYHLVCAVSSADERRARIARYVTEEARPEGSLPIHRANYLPERFATREPRPVPEEDLSAIAEVVGAGTTETTSPVPPSTPIPVARRAEIDRQWARRPLAADTHRARVLVVEGDTRLHAGQTREIHVRVTNLGSETWPGGLTRHPLIRVAYRWLAPGGAVVVPEGRRAPFPAALRPGRSCVLPVLVTAPDEPGRHVLEIDVVHEGARWFGCATREEITLSEHPARWLTEDAT
ncbi:MAG TPA: hypothetical protein VGF64_07725 [Acidimicrobiales bacterium]